MNEYSVCVKYKDFICFLEKMIHLIDISPEDAIKRMNDYRQYLVNENERMKKEKEEPTASGYS